MCSWHNLRMKICCCIPESRLDRYTNISELVVGAECKETGITPTVHLKVSKGMAVSKVLRFMFLKL